MLFYTFIKEIPSTLLKVTSAYNTSYPTSNGTSFDPPSEVRKTAALVSYRWVLNATNTKVTIQQQQAFSAFYENRSISVSLV
jgi:hypothetical protein